MAGFDNDTVYGTNIDFSGQITPAPTMLLDGQLLVGSTALNVGGTHCNIGNLTSPNSSIIFGFSSPNITAVVNSATIGQTITGDSGGALSPTAGNWNILGGPGVTTSGSGSTLTINSVVFTDTSGTVGLSVDNGYFATAASTFTLPASPLQGEVVIIYVDTTSSVVVTANTGQFIRLGTAVSSSAGTSTNTSRGDCLALRFRSSNNQWCSVSTVGNWTLA